MRGLCVRFHPLTMTIRRIIIYWVNALCHTVSNSQRVASLLSVLILPCALFVPRQQLGTAMREDSYHFKPWAVCLYLVSWSWIGRLNETLSNMHPLHDISYQSIWITAKFSFDLQTQPISDDLCSSALATLTSGSIQIRSPMTICDIT